MSSIASVTGNSNNPSRLARRFSPESNNGAADMDPIRVLLATDLLSEGQNLQDCAIVVNYDLPWAIIRLIQRAGRVDRIGQTADEILCYSFLPADVVERIINLRGRVLQRLDENAEVVGTDEAFFEDQDSQQIILDLYNERAGILDDDADTEVDLASHAYQIWKNALYADPSVEDAVVNLPDLVFSSRQHQPIAQRPEGVLLFMRTAEGNDALAYVDRDGESITESQLAILAATECAPNTPAMARHELHHELVSSGVKQVVKEQRTASGQLGPPSGARYRAYERLKAHAEAVRGQLYDHAQLNQTIDAIYRYPLTEAARNVLNRQMRLGADGFQLADIAITLRAEDRLSVVNESEADDNEPQIICSLGLFDQKGPSK